MDEREKDRLRHKMHLAQEYETMLKGDAGQDIMKFINDEFADAQNAIVLEEHQRVDKTGTDTLRGRLQMLSKFYQFVNGRIRDGYNAGQKIAKNGNVT